MITILVRDILGQINRWEKALIPLWSSYFWIKWLGKQIHVIHLDIYKTFLHQRKLFYLQGTCFKNFDLEVYVF